MFSPPATVWSTKRDRSPPRNSGTKPPKAKKALSSNEQTQLVLVKPEMLPHADEVRAWIERQGGNIIDSKTFQFNANDGYRFYMMYKMPWRNQTDAEKLDYFTNNGSHAYYASGASPSSRASALRLSHASRWWYHLRTLMAAGPMVAYKVVGENVLRTLGKQQKLLFRRAVVVLRPLVHTFPWGIVHTADKPDQVADETAFVFDDVTFPRLP